MTTPLLFALCIAATPAADTPPPAASPGPAAETAPNPEAAAKNEPPAGKETNPAGGEDASTLPEVRSDATLVVKVLDQRRAAEALIAKAQELGGFFVTQGGNAVTLRVPTQRLRDLMLAAEATGKVVDRSLTTQTVTPQLAQLRRQIESKRELLKKYFEVIDGATVGAVVTVERQISSLVTQVEQLEGQLKLLEYRSQLGELTVRFQFRDRRPPPDTDSSFPWLNRVGLTRLYQEFDR